jgi:hypothetical protein
MKLLYTIILIIGITAYSFQINALDSKEKTLENNISFTKKQTVRESKIGGISLMLGGSVLLGVSFNYTVIPNIDLDLHLGLMNGGTIKFYTNLDCSWNFYLGLGVSVSSTFSTMDFFWTINAPLGVQYMARNGFNFSLETGIAYVFVDERGEFEDHLIGPTEEKFIPMIGVKIGYSF